MAGQSPLLIALAIINFVVFLINIIFGAFNMIDTKEILGFELFPTSASRGTNRVYLEITPSPTTFLIWGPIFIWHFAWIIYGFVSMCRQTADGPVYTNPVLLTPGFYVFSIINWCCAIGWSFASGYEERWLAFAALSGMFLTTYGSIGFSYMDLAKHCDDLVKQKRKIEIWLVRFIVQNGLAVYAAWCTIATLIQLATALSYDTNPPLDQSISSTIALGILSVEFVVFILTDWFVLDKHSRYTLTPYIVVILALSGINVQNWNPEKRNSIFVAVLLAVACLCTVIKFVLLSVRHYNDARKQGDIRRQISARLYTKM